MHSQRLPGKAHPLLLSFLIVLATLTTISEGLSDRPVTAPSSNRSAETEAISSKASSMDSVPPEHAADGISAVTEPLPEMPLLPITSEETVRACRAMNVSPSRDVFVCSYPKSGTTWTQNIVVRLLWEIANDSENRSLPEDWHLSHSAPFYEVDQYWQQQQQRLPAQTPIVGPSCDEKKDGEYRVFNTHLLPHQLPQNAKCVYVVRDPLDVMVSFYHHLSNQAVEDGGFTGSFEEFFEGFLNGTIVYGKWQDHIETWLGEERKNGNVNQQFILLHYEDMKKDLAKETKRLARFLLREDGESSVIENTHDNKDLHLENIVSRVVPHCTFEAMKQEKKRYTPLSVSWKIDPKTGKTYDKFVRKGVVGDGRKLLLETTSSSSTLRHRWINIDISIARARWKNAGVNQEIIDRYL